MSREQFIDADRRVRRYVTLILFLDACAAVAVGLALPALANAREEFLVRRGEGAQRVLVGLITVAVVLGPLLLTPFLFALWVDRRFGLRCPECRRSITLRGRRSEILRSGRCSWCRHTLFEAGGTGDGL
jgi:hypothetical protein